MTSYSLFSPITTEYSQALQRAAWWLGLGVSLVPVHSGRKSIVHGFGPYQQHVCTPADARAWFDEMRCNMAVVCGGPAGLVVVDFDKPGALSRWQAKHDLPTLIETSSRPGRGHVFFFDPDASNAKFDGGEIHARGRVVTVAPSTVEGARYSILQDCEPLRIKVNELFPSSAQAPGEPGPVRLRASLRARRDGETLVERIKRERPILAEAIELFAERGRQLLTSKRDGGRWYHGLCVFHDDKEPSFWLDAQRGTFGCHAPHCEAHRGGDVINLYALRFDVSVQEAIEALGKGL